MVMTASLRDPCGSGDTHVAYVLLNKQIHLKKDDFKLLAEEVIGLSIAKERSWQAADGVVPCCNAKQKKQRKS